MENVIKVKKHNNIYYALDAEKSICYELMNHFTYEVPGAKFTPAYKARIWDGKIRLFSPSNRLLYIGLHEELNAFCKKRNYILQYDDDIKHDFEFSEYECNNFIKSLQCKYQPRYYQIQTFLYALRKRRALILSPTSSGKSLMIYLITRFLNKKTIIIVPTTSLVHQMFDDFVDYGMNPSNMHKILQGHEKNTDKQIVISTWQSIYKLPKQWFKNFEVVIGDEAHLFKAKSLVKIMTNLVNCEYRYGFTGTLDGTETNKLVLQGLFGPVKQFVSTNELIEKKYLSEFSVKILLLKHPKEIRKTYSSVDYQTEIDFIVKNKHRNKFIKNLALSLKNNTLLLFQYVDKHGKILYDEIVKDAIDKQVFLIYGDVPGDIRNDIREKIESINNALIIASYGTFSAGVNIKNLSNIIFASPSKSRIRNLQSIGRGLRISDTKNKATLYDIGDNLCYGKLRNHTYNHLQERIKLYTQEKFPFKTYEIDLDYTL